MKYAKKATFPPQAENVALAQGFHYVLELKSLNLANFTNFVENHQKLVIFTKFNENHHNLVNFTKIGEIHQI